MMLDEYLSLQLYTFMLVFCRIGAATIFLAGFGDSYVSTRARLVIALGVSTVLSPVLAQYLPNMPSDSTTFSLLIMAEFCIGLFIGLVSRIMLMALDVAGQLISFQASLSNAFVFNPALAQQGSLVGAFMIVTGSVLIFSSDAYQLMLTGLAESYAVFVPGKSPFSPDFYQYIVITIGKSFLLGFQISAPLVLVGFVFYLGLGLVTRLIPQIQVFFIGLPLQISLSLMVMAATLSAGMLWFLSNYKDVVSGYLG